jgi:hypothetical protein
MMEIIAGLACCIAPFIGAVCLFGWLMGANKSRVSRRDCDDETGTFR